MTNQTLSRKRDEVLSLVEKYQVIVDRLSAIRKKTPMVLKNLKTYQNKILNLQNQVNMED